jgi:EAL domain-containing protein (putative c-di-GMP-specific phosphodiesterase class I)
VTRTLLARYAAVLEKHFGARGTLGTLDQGTFTVILRGASEDALGLADQHRYSIYESRVKWRGRTLPLTVSVGVVELTSAQDLEAQLQSAAIACRKAQKDGGNRTQAYRPGIAHLVAQTRMDWSDAITRALAEDQLRLARQRIEPLAADGTTLPHYEILLRLQGPGGEVLAPGELIEAAERAGRMPEVDRWVLGRTLDWIAADPRRLQGVGGYAVNLSGQTLGSEEAVADLERMLGCGLVPAERILLEVTETAAIDSLRAANAAIERLRALGCQFCLDDFGTGAATYSYLKHLSVDYVKIDGMFVKDIADNASDLAMVRSVNEVSHYMGKRTIAEFVETPRVRELLGSLGVDYGQGYSIHRPELLPDFPPVRALDCGAPPVPD